MLNDRFVIEQSEHFARRVMVSAGPDQGSRMELAFRIALSRKPTKNESQWAADLIGQQTARYSKQTEPQLSAEQVAE